MLFMQHFSSTSQRSRSVCRSNGSRFDLSHATRHWIPLSMK